MGVAAAGQRAVFNEVGQMIRWLLERLSVETEEVRLVVDDEGGR